MAAELRSGKANNGEDAGRAGLSYVRAAKSLSSTLPDLLVEARRVFTGYAVLDQSLFVNSAHLTAASPMGSTRP